MALTTLKKYVSVPVKGSLSVNPVNEVLDAIQDWKVSVPVKGSLSVN